MIERADAARGDHRHRDRIGNRPRQFQVEADLGAVAVHRGEQDLARTKRHHFLRIGQNIYAGRRAAAMGKDLPARRLVDAGDALGVDGDDDRLAADLAHGLGDELPIAHRRRHDRHLVGAGLHQVADILMRADAAAHRHRHEADLRRAPHDIEDDATVFVAGGDIEEA